MTEDSKQPPQIHDLKTWPEYFQPVIGGRKGFEVRVNDRGFQCGDYLLLREYHAPGRPRWIDAAADPTNYTGRWCLVRVDFICELHQMVNYVGMDVTIIIDPYEDV